MATVRVTERMFEATVEVDSEAEPGLTAAFQVRAIPTLTALRDGILLAAQPGAIPAAALDEVIRKVRALDMNEVRRSLAPRKSRGAARLWSWPRRCSP